MDRRELVSAVAVGLVRLPIATEAQQAGRVSRLGILRATTLLSRADRVIE